MSGPFYRLANLDARSRAIAGGALALLLVAAGFFGVQAYRQSQPTSVGLNLKDGQREVRLDQRLVFTTSRPIDFDTFKDALRITPALDGAVAASTDGRTFTWTPGQPWADLTQYTVILDRIADAGGHRVDARRWRFTTTLKPRVISLSTGTGTLVSDYSEIPIGAPLQLTFNTVMDTASVQLQANGAPLRLSWSTDYEPTPSGRNEPETIVRGWSWKPCSNQLTTCDRGSMQE